MNYVNKDGDEFLIVNMVSYNEVYIQFIGYEEIIKTQFSAIKRKSIKNRMKPTIFGVGYLGKETASHPLYYRWYAMLNRCYNIKCEAYKNYGGKGVAVSNDWLCFSNYVEDVENMENYNKLLTNTKEWDIDKDISGNKLYSNSTCKIIRKTENLSLKTKKICQYSKSGEFIKEWVSLKQASDTLNINLGNISSCLNGKLKTSGGYKWSYKED